jgi:CTP-dependent riboflavin kinase
MIAGYGYEDRFLSEAEIRALASETLARAQLDGKRVLIIIPDRTAYQMVG